MTGFDQKTRDLICERDGWRCQCCGSSIDPWPGFQVHHRRPRGNGGSRHPHTNSPANGVLLCSSCHRSVESYRTEAARNGFLVQQGTDPSLVKLRRFDGEWVYLRHDGSVDRLADIEAEADAAAAGVPSVESATFRRPRSLPRGSDIPLHEAVEATKAEKRSAS